LTIATIVPATDEPATLDACVSAIRGAVDPPDEIIVVEAPAALGAAAARNLGAHQTDAAVLVFVDSDVTVHPDVFARIREHFDSDPGLSAVFGSYDDDPPAAGFVSTFRNLLHYQVHQNAAGPAETFWTGIGAVERSAFEAIGGFDDELATMEDVDFGMRLSATGRRILLDPQIQGTHLKRWSFWSMVRTDFAGRGVPWTVLLLRHGRSSTALNLGWAHRLSGTACLVACAALARRRYGVALAAGIGFIALNRDFHGFLFRRFGGRKAAAGVGLHAVHHLVGIASVPVGVAAFLSQRRREDRRR
jgi:GT2 family glycosyltransferase